MRIRAPPPIAAARRGRRPVVTSAGMDGGGRRPRRVVMLPPIEWLPYRRMQQPDSGPDMAALERHLAEHGIEVTILDPSPFPWNPFARRHPLLKGIDPLRALRVLLFHRHVDAIVPVFEGPALLPALLRRLLFFRPRLVEWDIGLTETWRLRRHIQDIVVPRLDEVLVLGSNQLADIAARWPGRSNATFIGHYVDTEFYRPMASEGGGFVLAVGDDEGRDYACLLAAAATLDQEIAIRSSRPLPLDPVRHARVRHIAERLSFLALRRLYADAGLVVVPMLDRPHPGGVTAILEAAAMGKAMVVSASRGILDYCRDGETCLLVPCGDSAALAAAIGRLAGDAALRERLGRNARAYAERECSTKAMAARLAPHLKA